MCLCSYVYTHVCTYIYIYMYIYVCMRMCDTRILRVTVTFGLALSVIVIARAANVWLEASSSGGHRGVAQSLSGNRQLDREAQRPKKGERERERERDERERTRAMLDPLAELTSSSRNERFSRIVRLTDRDWRVPLEDIASRQHQRQRDTRRARPGETEEAAFAKCPALGRRDSRVDTERERERERE